MEALLEIFLLCSKSPLIFLLHGSEAVKQALKLRAHFCHAGLQLLHLLAGLLSLLSKGLGPGHAGRVFRRGRSRGWLGRLGLLSSLDAQVGGQRRLDVSKHLGAFVASLPGSAVLGKLHSLLLDLL